ncbi:DUF6702 family protein [Pedobacter sp. MW01-1-1]|uniref:DUF6702 family protein n=1 Tax=Pedobacter sp. MW01-1-1 TaxID=3383027 RepID=UPI003FF0AA7C
MLLFLGNLSFSEKHPLHVSTTEVNYNERTKSLEISARVFTDDFEAILVKLYKQKTDLLNEQLKDEMNELVRKYMLTHLQIKINNKVTAFKYIGFEVDHEAVNVYLEAEKVPTPKSLSIASTILYDLYNDQMSILHVVNNGTRKSTKLVYPEKVFVVNF